MILHALSRLGGAMSAIILTAGLVAAAPFAYIPQEGGNTVSVIDTASGLITKVIQAGNSPSEMAVSPDGRKVYVAGTGSGIGVIDTSNNTYTTLAGSSAYGGIHGLALSADGRTLYAVQTAGTILVINTTTGSYTSIAGVNVLTDIALSPDGSKLYVTNYYNSTVSVVTTADNSVTTVTDAGSTIALPYGVSFVPGMAKAYVANSANNTVSIINTATNTVTGNISGMSTPLAVAVSPDGSRAYVSNYGSNSVAVIDTANDTVLTAIPVGGHPRGISVTPDGSQVVACSDSIGAALIIDAGTKTLTATVVIGASFGYGNSTPYVLPANKNLVSLWRGEENPYDATGSNNGLWIGTPAYAVGKTGRAFDLNGSCQYLEVPSGPFDFGSDPFTVSFWFNARSTGSGTYLVGKSHPDGGTGFDVRLHDNAIQVTGVNGWGFNITSDSVISIGTWHHVVVAAATDGVVLFIDGIERGRSARSSISSTANPLRFGCTTSFGGQGLDGLLDEVAIYNRALSSGEALSLAKNTLVVTPPFRDEFNGGMRPEWRITNPNPATIATQPSALRLTTTATDLAGTTDNLQNLLTLPLPTDADNITVTAKFSFPVQPGVDRQQVGVVLLAQDPNNPDLPSMENYFRAMYGYNNGLAYGYARDINNTPNSVHSNIWALNIPAGVPFWIRVTKKWKEAQQYVYTASYSNEGNYFHEYLSGEQPFTFTHVGVFALQGVGNATPLAFDVDYVEVAPLAQPGTMPSGLVSWWAADNTPNDALGLNHATLVGSPSYATGIVNQAFSFNGTSQYAQVAVPLNLPVGAAPRTVSLWFKTPRDLSSSTESALIQYGTASDGNMFGLIFSGNAPGKLYFYGHSADIDGLTTILPNTWYHTAAVYDGTNVRLYLNGTPDGEAPLALNTVLDASGLTFGYRSPGSMWEGQIEDVAIFDRALNPTEIQFVMNATRDITPDYLNFTAVTNAALSTSYESNAVTISSINMPADISIINGEYAVSSDGGTNWSSWTATAGTVVNGSQVKIRLMSSDSGGTATYADLSVGNMSGQFSVTTQAVADTTPNAFSFTSLTGVQLSTVIESNTITVAGINAAASISIADGEYAISTDSGSTWGGWTSVNGTVSLNNQVKVRQTSSASISFTTSATLTIGGVTGSFDVTTHETPMVGTGLFAWWKGEFNTLDSIGGNNGTWTGTPAYGAGRYGQAFSFDGNTGSIGVGMLGTTALNETLPFSISGWIKVNETYIYQVIASNYMGERDGINNYSTHLTINEDNLIFGVGKRQIAETVVSTPITTGWHQVTATYDGSVLKLYLDGRLKGTATRSFSGSTDNTRGWYIGNFSPETNSSHQSYGFNGSATFNGLIDELAIYNRALTATEAVTLYNQNLDFEIDPVNTAGPAISDWAYEFFTMNDSGTRGQSPTADHELKTTNARSYSGIQSVYSRIHSFGGSSNQDPDYHYPTHQLSTDYRPQPGKTLTDLTIWRSDISYTTSSRYFYWFNVQLTDGTRTEDFMLACRAWGNNEGCTNNFQDTSDQSASGSDGQTWYRHTIPVSPRFDQSRLTIRIQHTERSWDGSDAESSLYYDLLTETTPIADNSPDPFSFASQIDVPLSATVTSEAITVTGINVQAAISVVNGQYEMNGSGTWTETSGTVLSGDSVKVRSTSSIDNGTTTVAILTIGDQSEPFAVTTTPELTVSVSASPSEGGSASGGGTVRSTATKHPYLEIVKTDGTVVIYRPDGGANDGTDQGGLTTGKDSNIRQDSTSVTSGSSEALMIDNSNCNPFTSHAFLQWDVSTLPLATDVAKVSFISYHWIFSAYFPYPLATTTLEVRVPSAAWDESTLSWDSNPGIDPTLQASAILPAPQSQGSVFDGPLTIDITTLYREWKTGSRSNNGIVVSRSEPFCENGSPHLMYSSDYSVLQFHPNHVVPVPTPVTVTATPNTGYHFVNWTENGAAVSTSEAYTFTPSASRTLVANFAINTYSVTFQNGGHGSIDGTTSQTVNYGDSATAVTAVPAFGYHFDHWSGDNGFVITTNNPLTVTNVTSDMTVTAYFVDNPITLGASEYATSNKITATLSYPSAAQMQFSFDNIKWTKWEAYASSKMLSLSATNGPRKVYCRFMVAGGTTSPTYSDTIMLDTKAPTGTMKINNGDLYTNNRTVTLAITAIDATSGMAGVCVKESTIACGNAEFVPFIAAIVYTITSPGDGKKTVYATLRDAAGKSSKPIKASITRDTIAPTGSIIINNLASTTATAAVKLKITAVKASQMQLSLDGGVSWGDWEKVASGKNVTLPAGAGIKTVKVKFRDLSGNESPEYEDSITLL